MRVCVCMYVCVYVHVESCAVDKIFDICPKNRGEFDSEGTPDLNKDVYLQDIHCVSSVCKAYFRELPNPLLTYQLYDKFAVSDKNSD